MTTTPLTVLDLVPISSGSTATQALRNSIDLAQQTERLGYARYSFAEHHLNPGVAGTSPAVVLALTAAATSTIRLGSGAVQMGHRTALSTVEEFGLLDALHPGRFDLGLGRSGFRAPRRAAAPDVEGGASVAKPTADGAPRPADPRPGPRRGPAHPAPILHPDLLPRPGSRCSKTLLQLPGAETPITPSRSRTSLALIDGTYRADNGDEAHIVPGEGATVEIWILGSSGGESAEVAGDKGLPFAANYHVSPATVLEAVDGYRAAFRPSAARPALPAYQPTSWSAATRPRSGAGYRLWPVGAQHPHRIGRHPVPHARGSAPSRVDGRGPRPRAGPHRHPTRRLGRHRRRPAGASPRAETGADES